MIRDFETDLWLPRALDEALLVPAPWLCGRGMQQYACGKAVGVGFKHRGIPAALQMLMQLAASLKTVEDAGGAAALYTTLAGYPTYEIDTGYGGGYQRIPTWNDAFRTGGPYPIPGHTSHSATQATSSYASNLTTLAGGGEAALSFDNSTCRYSLAGAFAAKTAHSIFCITDARALQDHQAYTMAQSGVGGRLGESIADRRLSFAGTSSTYSTFTCDVGQAAYGVVADNSSPNVFFSKNSATELVARAAAVVAFTAPTLLNYTTGTYGISAKWRFLLYCSGNHPELAPLVNALQAYSDFTASGAVAVLNQIRTICSAEEGAGGSSFMLLPGDWAVVYPVQTWFDVLTGSVIPGVGWGTHTAHNLVQTTDANEPWLNASQRMAWEGGAGGMVTTMTGAPNSANHGVFAAGLFGSSTGFMLDSVGRWICRPFSSNTLQVYNNAWQSSGVTPTAGLHTVSVEQTGTVGGAGTARIYVDGSQSGSNISVVACAGLTGTTTVGGSLTNSDTGLLLYVVNGQSQYATLRSLVRELGKILYGTP